MTETLDRVVGDWPEEAQEAARRTAERYGPPDETMPRRLVWNHPLPWKRIVVNRDASEHHFPEPHQDRIESWVDLEVPRESAADVAAFNGSIRVNRTRGEVAATCHVEAVNFLAVNLAHDLVSGRIGVDEARREYTEMVASHLMGRPQAYTSGFAFEPASTGAGTADEDRPVAPHEVPTVSARGTGRPA
ncbi:hypothetical protein RB614_07825 [Phytohabitans sp. ZYX-F-186]|uniref:Uncharacterized protein n=1 Tax=Phytohabitans maris TaxID=3071409 RepID=A0ABU0ZDF2_9ACTN|nr:hypothetical protein [Phytohabitans sp. ZYX-F-186]MDQ7904431.1 hypothetical protein [Phytohabitans sp. ZYX-F-186]